MCILFDQCECARHAETRDRNMVGYAVQGIGFITIDKQIKTYDNMIKIYFI